jgi:hypothetical protein
VVLINKTKKPKWFFGFFATPVVQSVEFDRVEGNIVVMGEQVQRRTRRKSKDAIAKLNSSGGHENIVHVMTFTGVTVLLDAKTNVVDILEFADTIDRNQLRKLVFKPGGGIFNKSLFLAQGQARTVFLADGNGKEGGLCGSARDSTGFFTKQEVSNVLSNGQQKRG